MEAAMATALPAPRSLLAAGSPPPGRADGRALAGSGFFEGGGDFLAGVLLPARDDDAGAVGRHLLGHGAADTAGGAGDDGGLAGEIEEGLHLLTPFVLSSR